MSYLPLILIAIVIYWFWIRPGMENKTLSNNLQNSLLKYGIKGMGYRDFDRKLRSGTFIGYICNEPDNDQDENAIAIYNSNGLHLGYIPAWKTEDLKKLFGQKLDDSVKIFGITSYDRSTRNWSGVIYVPNNIDMTTQAKLYKKFTNNPTSFENLEWA